MEKNYILLLSKKTDVPVNYDSLNILLCFRFFFSRNLSSTFFFRNFKGCKTSFSSQHYILWRKSLQAVAWEVERTVSLLWKWWSLGKEQQLLVCFREINRLFRGSVEVTNALVKIWSVLTIPITLKITFALSVSCRLLNLCCKLNSKEEKI